MEEYKNLIYGNSLTAKRLNANVSQQDLADALGVEPAYIASWEKGDTSPTEDEMKEAHEYLSGAPIKKNQVRKKSGSK